MAIFTNSNIKIAGISACVPKKIVYNKDYKWISEKERKSLIKTIGVEQKHHCSRKTTSSDLCYVAATKLIDDLNWDRNEIDLIIFVTQTADYKLPATACILQERLGLPNTCLAFDVNLGCSGYVYGLSIITGMIQNGGFRKALLLSGDTSSFGTYKDKTSYPLFGDAGTATAIEYKVGASKMHFNLQTDGKGYKAIIIPESGYRKLPTKKSFDYKSYGKGIFRNKHHVVLDGVTIFNFSLKEVQPNINNLLNHINKNINDFDFIVFHQANYLMINTIRRMMKIKKEKFPLSIKEYGNTSSASIPLTIVSELRENIKNGKINLLLSGFGVGLSWGSNTMELNKVSCPEIIIYEDYIKKYGANKI